MALCIILLVHIMITAVSASAAVTKHMVQCSYPVALNFRGSLTSQGLGKFCFSRKQIQSRIWIAILDSCQIFALRYLYIALQQGVVMSPLSDFMVGVISYVIWIEKIKHNLLTDRRLFVMLQL